MSQIGQNRYAADKGARCVLVLQFVYLRQNFLPLLLSRNLVATPKNIFKRNRINAKEKTQPQSDHI